MLSFEERLTALEQSQKRIDKNIDEVNRHMTILLGLASKQEMDIKEIKASVWSIDRRLENIEGRFAILESRFGSQESRLNSLENRLGTFEQNVNSRFEKQDEKLDNVVVLLNTLIAQRS